MFAPGYRDKFAIKAQPAENVLVTLHFMSRSALHILLFVHPMLGASLREHISYGDFFYVTEDSGSLLDSGNGTLGEPLNVNHSSVIVHIMMTDRRQLGRHLRPRL